MKFTKDALFSVVLALGVNETPRRYTELIRAARARTPVDIERQKNCGLLATRPIHYERGGYLMLADTGRNGENVKPDSHAYSTSGVFVIIFREINYCLIPLCLSIYRNANERLEVSYPDKDRCHEL